MCAKMHFSHWKTILFEMLHGPKAAHGRYTEDNIKMRGVPKSSREAPGSPKEASGSLQEPQGSLWEPLARLWEASGTSEEPLV